VKKYLALLLIAIMAVSVLSAANVVAAQPAAKPTAGTPTYTPGAIYIYTPKQFNSVGLVGPEYSYITSAGPPKYSEAIHGGDVSTSISTTSEQAVSLSAFVGMGWELSLPSTGQYSTWAAVKNMPCTVTMTVFYTIQARGDQNTSAGAYWGPWLGVSSPWWSGGGSPPNQVSAVGGRSVNVKVGVGITTWHGTVGALFQNEGFGFAGAGVYSAQSSFGAGQAASNIVCTSIVLAFPR
jgi:hypothetical protein